MNLRKEDFTGTGKVFAFTLRQLIFNKANIISVVILLLISILGMPVLAVIKGGSFFGGGDSGAAISKIYYTNDSQWEFSPEDIVRQDDTFAKTPFEEADFTLSELEEKGYEKYLKEDEVFLCISDSVQVYGADSVNMEYESLAGAAGDALQQNRLTASGAAGEQLKTAKADYSTATSTMEEYYKDQEGPGWGIRYGVQYAYAIILMMLCMFTSSYILRSVIEEKASKLVELLMVSVKPMAMIMGKILAVMVFVFGMFFALGIGFGISSLLTMVFMNTSADISAIISAAAGSSISFEALQLDPVFIIAVLISFVLGYLTFSILSGIAGCSCSTMEDMESASMNVVLVLMAGYFVSVIAINFRSIAVVVSLIPIVSIFCAPIEYVCGNIGIGILMLSWIIQVIAVVFLFKFCAQVYQSLIMYKGQKMKILQMIRLARTMKKEQKGDKIS
ncbi:MAG: ABC transporter permease [Hespellia sp.]|nr:ABC transporter permease [Hespellia sp.]